MIKKILTSAACVAALATAGTAHAQMDDPIFTDAVQDRVNAAQDAMAAAGISATIEMAEILTESEEAGRMVFFNDRGNKQLGADFVPGDGRRFWNLFNGAGVDAISYIKEADPVFAPVGLDISEANAAIDAAMATWDGQKCSKGLNIYDSGDVFFPLPGLDADMVHWGWVGLPPGILGVTFTAVFIDFNTGQPTDIDNDGNADTAYRFILYNSNFPWATDGNPGAIDIETVALHEAGHGLSQAHFGSLSQTDSNGKFHFAPRAVMNAGYTGVQRDLAGTDKGGHCSNWGQWPKN